jgi:hypothetical protein
LEQPTSAELEASDNAVFRSGAYSGLCRTEVVVWVRIEPTPTPARGGFRRLSSFAG